MVQTLRRNVGIWKIGISGVILIGLLLIAAQCNLGSTPTPVVKVPTPEILGFVLDPPSPVLPDAQIKIQVDVNRHGHKIDDYRWIVEAGKGSILDGYGTPSITYQAPDTSGSYEVRVQLEYEGGQSVEEATIIEVIEPMPMPTPPIPTQTYTPTPTLTYTPTPMPAPPTPTQTYTPTPSPTATSTPTATPSPMTTPTPLPQAVVISENGLDLYLGPGPIYGMIGPLPKGEVLNVQGRLISNDWIEVARINSGTIGWISTAPDLVQLYVVDLDTIPIGEPPIPATPLPPPTLLEPQPNAGQYVRIDLEWDWPGILGQNDYFRVEIWNRKYVFNQFDDSVPTIDVAWVKNKFYGYDKIEEAYDREYRWRITVVRGIPLGYKQWSPTEGPLEDRIWQPAPEGQFELISYPSEMRTLYVEPGTGPVPGNPNGNGNGVSDPHNQGGGG